MAIDWTSAVPVWSDTHLPAESSSSSAPLVTGLPPQDHENGRVIPPTSGDSVGDESQHLEDLAVEFFVRYAKTFDTERHNVVSAYHPNARFSYSVHELFQRNTVAAAFIDVKKVERFAAFKNSRNLAHRHDGRIYTGCREIAEAMSSLGPHKFCGTSPADVHWSVCHLSPSPYIQLLCHGYISDAGQQRISFEQSLLLVKPDGNSGDTPDAWPLVIVSHLLTVRDTSLMLMVV